MIVTKTQKLFHLGLMLCLLSILCAGCAESNDQGWGVLQILAPDPDVLVDEPNLDPIYHGITVGVRKEISDQLTFEISEYAEGVFGMDVDKLMGQIFPGVFKSEREMVVTLESLKESKNKYEYELFESYPKFISRAVDVGDYFAFAVEERAWFEVKLGEKNKDARISLMNSFKSQYGDDFVSYDEDRYAIVVDGAHVIYAMTPKDSLNFMFMSEMMMHSTVMRNFVPKEKFLELRRYFDEMEIYQ